MQDTETPHPDYQKGFNEGYLMKKHLPDLADKLAEAVNSSERGAGFKDGRNEMIAELKRERMPSWLRSDKPAKPDNRSDKSKDIDRGDFDRE